MNHSLQNATLDLTLTRFEKPMAVDMERYFEFSFDLAEDLLDLESLFKTRRTSRRAIANRANKVASVATVTRCQNSTASGR